MNDTNAQFFHSSIAYDVWDSRYRLRTGGNTHENSIVDTWHRISHALAAVEPDRHEFWEDQLYQILKGFRFLPGGRIQAGAGSQRRITLFNCFVMGRIEDSVGGIFEALQEGALTMQQGGGIGYDFSSLRPRGDPAAETGGVASGPVSFMRLWDRMCEILIDSNVRRGAMMGVLSCSHPDIEQFIAAKAQPGELRHFNLSILVSDAFMQAVADDAQWPLVFPCAASASPEGKKIRRHISARQLWQQIMQANYDHAEPGVIFIDRVRRMNNLGYCEEILATNPCGEIPLPAYGACDLGSLNLTTFVQSPFTPQAAIDWQHLRQTATIAVRLLDNVYDLSNYPLAQQREAAQRARRIGLGITGLADTLIMLGLRYDEKASLQLASTIMQEICHSAYRASIALAKEKGPFPAFSAEPYLRSPFIAALPTDIREGIAQWGMRNSHLTAIAPTGTISLLANNISSGFEPVFAAEYDRLMHTTGDQSRTLHVVDYAVQQYRTFTENSEQLPPAFVTSANIAPEAQLAMQAALQKYVDNAISKTVNVPKEFPFERFRSLFDQAYQLELKGCTTFRPNPVTGSVLFAHCARGRCSSVPMEDAAQSRNLDQLL